MAKPGSAVMVAKFGGKCIECGKRIEAGESIKWFKGVGIQHAGCR